MSNPPGDEQPPERIGVGQQPYQPPGYPPQAYPPPGYPAQGYPQPGYWQPAGYPQALPVPGWNGLAIASMILGIVWVYWIGSILAVIFGHIALHQIRRDGTRGRGMAIAGLVLGYLGIAVIVLILILGLATSGSSGG